KGRRGQRSPRRKRSWDMGGSSSCGWARNLRGTPASAHPLRRGCTPAFPVRSMTGEPEAPGCPRPRGPIIGPGRCRPRLLVPASGLRAVAGLLGRRREVGECVEAAFDGAVRPAQLECLGGGCGRLVESTLAASELAECVQCLREGDRIAPVTRTRDCFGDL